uniref:G protein-coupled receptor n=1 Tax=Bursaphelenchus xylophilus TaxID=6326 RepID=A0A1I7RW05_BURXY
MVALLLSLYVDMAPGSKPVPHGTIYFYLTDSPFLLHTSQLAQQFALHLTFATIYIHAALPSIQFFIRYNIIKDKRPNLRKLYTSFIGLVLFCGVYSCTYEFDFEEQPESYRQLLYSGVKGCNLDDVLPTYSVIDKSAIISRIHGACVVVILGTSSVVVAYYGVLTWLHFKQRLAKTTYQMRKFNRDINLVLTFQALLPFTFVVLPNSLFLANLVPVNMTSTVGLIANFGSTTSPLLDALIVLFVIPAFRRNVLKSLSSSTHRSSNTIFTTL